MSTQTQNTEYKALNLQILDELFSPGFLDGIKVQLWDGTVWPADKDTTATLILRSPGSLRSMLLSGTEVGMAESYLFDDVDIDGSVEAVFDILQNLAVINDSPRKKLALFNLLRKLPETQSRGKVRRPRASLSGRRHTIDRDKQAVRYHYDVSNDFYALWLDSNMVYSCGYFLQESDPIAQAQIQKMDLICRKLRLRSGQRLLDLGCGWGGLVIYAAQHYNVDATGITLSQPQADFANRRIEELGLGGKCRVLMQDYRELSEKDPFDVLVSVGMFEHVGSKLLPTYFEKAYKLLKTHGVFLNHGISSTITVDNNPRGSFSDSYVFPDGELVPIQQTISAGELANFEVRDVESLREHYVLTLRQWVARLEQHHDEALEYVDEHTYRVWRLYMSGSIQGFKSRRLNLYQTLFVKPGTDGSTQLPLTRSDWYCDAPIPPQP